MAWTDVEITALVEEGRAEDRQLDFKRELYRQRDPKDKREWCKDATAFANASGGTLLLGVQDEGGVARQLLGVPAEDVDAAMSWMAGTVRSWTVPPAGPHVTVYPVEVGGLVVLVVDIVRSWARPHAVREPGQDRMEFFRRDNRENLPIDAAQVAEIVRNAESLPARLEAFHADRVAAHVAGELPFQIGVDQHYVFTVTPWAAVQTSPSRHDVATLRPPLLDQHQVIRPVLEGVVVVDTAQAYDETVPAFQQALLHRTGAVEFVSSAGFYPSVQDENILILGHLNLEEMLVAHLCGASRTFDMIGVSGPVSVQLTLLGTSGVQYHMTSHGYSERLASIRRPSLHMPRLDLPVVPAANEQSVASALRPMFDALANAIGKYATPSFDNNGHWDIHRQR